MKTVKLIGGRGFYEIEVDGVKVGYIEGTREVWLGLYTGEKYENGRLKAVPVMRIKCGHKKTTRAKSWAKAVLANLTPAEVIEKLKERDERGFSKNSPLSLGREYGAID